MIDHVMMFWFTPSTAAADRDDVLDGIRRFSDIPSVRRVVLGENRDFPETSAPFTHTAILSFDDREGRGAFFDDERHRSLREKAVAVFGGLKTMSVLDGERPDLEHLAAILREAERSGTPAAPLTEQEPLLTAEDAYRIQQINVARKIGDGAEIVGQKVGLTAVVMQEQLGVDEPDYGVLFADMIVGDDEPMSIATMIQPRVEAEIAFVMERELRGPGVTEAQAMSAVSGALPVIEVIDSRITDWRIKLQDTVADNASCARVVRGPDVTPLDGLDLAQIRLVLSVDGEPVDSGVGSAVLGHPIRGVVWLANKLGELGGSLRPGDLVLAGALHASLPVSAGQSVRADFTDIGAVTAQFTA